MQRIFPKAADTTLVRNGAATNGRAVCELGIYAPYLGDGERTYVNTISGRHPFAVGLIAPTMECFLLAGRNLLFCQATWFGQNLWVSTKAALHRGMHV